MPICKLCRWASSTASSNLLLRHRLDAVVVGPTYGVLIRIVRSEAEPSAAYFSPPMLDPLVAESGIDTGIAFMG